MGSCLFSIVSLFSWFLIVTASMMFLFNWQLHLSVNLVVMSIFIYVYMVCLDAE